MRILAFTDPHAQKDHLDSVKKKAKQADLVICCGDFTIFDNGLDEVLDLLEKLGKKVLLVHGNHEDEHQVAGKCKKLKNVTFLHKAVQTVQGISFIGYGGGGFAHTDAFFETWSSLLANELKKKKTVLVVHQPPHDTKIDYLEWAGHVGSKSFRKFIDEVQPKLVLCGHLHETFNMQDKVKNSIILNPGPDGTLIEV